MDLDNGLRYADGDTDDTSTINFLWLRYEDMYVVTWKGIARAVPEDLLTMIVVTASVVWFQINKTSNAVE